MKWNGEEINNCCSNPDLRGAKIMFRLPLFKAVYCKNCGEVTSVMGVIAESLFSVFFCYFWTGKVYIKFRKGEDD